MQDQSLHVLDRTQTVQLDLKWQVDEGELPRKAWEILKSLLSIVKEERVMGFQQVGPKKYQITMKNELEAKQLNEVIAHADNIEGMHFEARQLKNELAIIAYNCPVELTDAQLKRSLDSYLDITNIERQV